MRALKAGITLCYKVCFLLCFKFLFAFWYWRWRFLLCFLYSSCCYEV